MVGFITGMPELVPFLLFEINTVVSRMSQSNIYIFFFQKHLKCMMLPYQEGSRHEKTDGPDQKTGGSRYSGQNFWTCAEQDNR